MLKGRWRIPIFVWALTCWFGSANSADKSMLSERDPSIRVVVPMVSHWSADTADSPLTVAMKRVLLSMPVSTELIFVQQNRGIEMFLRHEVDCLLGADRSMLRHLADFPVLESTPFLPMELRVFNLPPAEPVRDREALKTLRLGAQPAARASMVTGLGIKAAEIDIASDISQNVEKLKRGRVDALVIGWPKAHHLLSGLQSDPGLVLERWNEAVLCHPDEPRRQFVEVLNDAIRQNQKSGEIPPPDIDAWLSWRPWQGAASRQ
ncbi:hypothetical protein [Permianibacter aggregans]|uniref:Solute-binding protein family 3/N-terminal domain-containing protein n=1 Tax=Permianibacter aggregans TaxID=1510150 RepID=A0A4R6UIW7_9GAMM|nr:hypothetical protein [Permianibacter aggregans]TDQ46036.1 hypothetical protein EV696_11530 [Permianibacter aggregans]